MKKSPLLFIICILAACSDRNSMENYSLLTNLGDMEQTVFVPALESPVGANENVIYTPTLLFAWDEVRKVTGQPIEYTADSLSDFDVLNTSTSFLEALDKGEYKTTVEVEEDKIATSASFKKSLFFGTEFQKAEKPLLFGDSQVRAFGMYDYQEDVAKNISMLHYRSDSLFVISLRPKEEGHEIILAKGIDSIQSLSDAYSQINLLIKTGRQDTVNIWKHFITSMDKLSIPVISFNLETNYGNIEGQNFKVVVQEYNVVTARQTTKFVLNESGAAVESYASVEVKSVSAVLSFEEQKPKNLVFDKPFIIIMKHRNRTNPYFVARIANEELLVKEVN
ncbi:hypothetical protein M2451_002799 [Dysgonomonas sp. PFB1-18]|uniref:hypothetical protein n=1 Tax=unclassified Dysgonomonas TaxID=2630389 RepID=UPI002475A17E|nr:MULTISPECIES: hypothetical protein [unclassified Dysgonomonas]MDH6309315.1 hypothetical protein [Dysgonomonas sp. PF1-14]MDH6339820.1 hypothetical protein [Dysgonomonas sp. PF1-16]MDH6381468.1 hypothetical protein [Dysgonomonas sp. PFB1-18]MDH6398683.1 hypothetical protein [Dysgonomonas sp. PF1-23]